MDGKLGGELRQDRPLRRDIKEAVQKWRRESRGCPSKKELAAYVQGNLPLRRRLRIWWHINAPLRRCALCCTDLMDLRPHRSPVSLGTVIPAYGTTMALLGPLIFLGAGGGLTYMTLRGQERAFVERLQLNNKTLVSQFSAIGQQMTPQLTMAVSVSDQELLSLSDVIRKLEKTLGATIMLQPVDRHILVPALEERVATGSKPWDLLSVDNDTLGILVQKGLVQDLSPYLRDGALPRDPLFQDLQEKLRIDGRDYYVPFHPNVKLTYYNQAMLNKAGKQPPTTSDELVKLARELASDDRERVAIQAHEGKAAAVTVFEWVTSMGGDPLTLADAGAREAFKRLWALAPYLEPESNKIQFDTANNVLITNKVSVVDNWTYGIKVVMGDFEKTQIRVTPGMRGSVRVLGGDVLAIPKGARHPEQAIKLIEQLVAKETQRTLAEHLFWAPVREDVYTELSATQQGLKNEYFQVIREGLRTTVMRPITPNWGVIQDVLSDALQDVLEQGRTQGTPATDAQIDALLRPYLARLQAIPPDTYKRCDLVARKTTSDEPCVEGPTGESFAALFLNPEDPPDINELARTLKTEPGILATVNGRGEWDIVSPKTMSILLVPNKKGG
jgi:trehalose transport system substrate-binding protein